MTKVHAYVFEAKSIQRYVTDGGRLKDVAGASALLHALTDRDTTDGEGPLDKALRIAGFTSGDAMLARRAGGAFSLVDGTAGADQRLTRFRALWRLSVGVTVPGLGFSDAIGEADSARAAVEDAQTKAASGYRPDWPDRPPIGPLTMMAQRTGRAAVKTDNHDSNEFLDGAQEKKRDDLVHAKRTLGKHLAPDAMASAWPDEVEDMIPEGVPRRTLAVLHIDANGMGEHLKAVATDAENMPEPFEQQMRAFSDKVQNTIRDAARAATSNALTDRSVKRGMNDCIPARPIVLAGDELTLVMRADCALPFLKSFVANAESEIRRRKFSFGAGIAFVHVRHPFSDAVELAASLCAFAKRDARRRLGLGGSGCDMPSVVAFHRALEARGGDYARILSRDLTVAPESGRPVCLTLGPYKMAGDTSGELPTLSGLESLTSVLATDEASRGPLRRCLAEVQDGLADQADRTFNRWRTVVPEATRTALDNAIFCGLDPSSDGSAAAMDPEKRPSLFIRVDRRGLPEPATALADAQALLAAAGPPAARPDTPPHDTDPRNAEEAAS